MGNYQENLKEEKQYLKYTLDYIKEELDEQVKTLQSRKEDFLENGREMWENTVHYTDDFERLIEVSQYLSMLDSQTKSYNRALSQMKRYKKMMKSPYFGRFDFVEEDSKEKEKIYIGVSNLIDSDSYEVIIYDWRAPISSIFYQYDLGNVSYDAPVGVMNGEVLLKRQYQINDSQLEYFFDSSIRINDEILQQVLGRNTSSKMRNIVETIQKEQDVIIRDIDNNLLIVQGVAGSGKTSIALHRIAYLLYNSTKTNLTSRNFLIISPNTVFTKYISDVLPELGEENVEQVTLDEITIEMLKNSLKIESKLDYLELLIGEKDYQNVLKRESHTTLKDSRDFAVILTRLLEYYERNRIEFKDVYYHGKIIETKQLMRNQFLKDKIGIPTAKRLKRIEKKILNRIHALQKDRVNKITKLMCTINEHQLDFKPFSRLLSIKESIALLKKIRKFTEIGYLKVYHLLFNDKTLFFRLAEGIKLPHNIEEIIEETRDRLEKGYIPYEDCAPLLFLKLKIEGNNLFSEIRQVVIDEAQDYSPMQYEVFNLLFSKANFTILGDVNQSIDKKLNISLYDRIIDIFNRKKSIKMFLNTCYRSSYEISTFSNKILNLQHKLNCFERHETMPIVQPKKDINEIENAIINDVKAFEKEGYSSIALVCKTVIETEKLYERLKTSLAIKLINSDEKEIESETMIIPAYMVKGLEFDAVIVYNASADNYVSELDKKLLYITCTRALHRLSIYYTGEISPFIPLNENIANG